MKQIPDILITMGDPGGIGPEVVAMALSKLQHTYFNLHFHVLGDAGLLEQCGLKPANNITVESIGTVNPYKPGKVLARYGRVSLKYLDRALEIFDLCQKKPAIVTAPICKESIQKAGSQYAGHTELFADYFKIPFPVMMFIGEGARIVLMTRHVPLKKVSRMVNQRLVEQTLLTTWNTLQKLFLLSNPHIAVAALNPHASDGGVIGTEETDVIVPAIKAFNKKYKAAVEGPLPTDAVFLKAAHYDAVVSIYHDQALLAFKLLEGFTGVNFTAGLPVIRTSPVHGTGFDIVGRSVANPTSMINAITLAIELQSVNEGCRCAYYD